MRFIKFFFSALLFTFPSLFSASAPQLGVGLDNGHNICYMNALIACLYDVTPFRKAVYARFEESVVVRAIAYVFGLKQLNLVPSINTEHILMSTISNQAPHWEFGLFQDIDEFMKLIFLFFPPSVTDIIGYAARERITTVDNYVLTEGIPTRFPMVTVHLPERPSTQSLSLQELVNAALSGYETRDYTITRADYPRYFEENQIDDFILDIPTQVNVQQCVSQYADVVPVFVARSQHIPGKNKKIFRMDPLHKIEMLTFPLDNGQSAQFILTGFAVFTLPGHYYAYTKLFPSGKWLIYNDASVKEVNTDEVTMDLRTKAVMMFYVKKDASDFTVIPKAIENWAMTYLTLNNMEEVVISRIKKMIQNFKKYRK